MGEDGRLTSLNRREWVGAMAFSCSILGLVLVEHIYSVMIYCEITKARCGIHELTLIRGIE